MCRWLAWSGCERYFEDFIFSSDHSLLDQSREALFCKSTINADGYGLAWYSQRDDEPCVYKSVLPAWADANLQQISHHTSSKNFLAHVRASTGSSVSHGNCHPFKYKNLCFMHNGQIGGYETFRKKLDSMISEELYNCRQGTNDSEAIFLIALSLGLSSRPIEAMSEAVHQSTELARRYGSAPYMRFAGCWSDGKRLFAARYASDDNAPSLYYCVEKGKGTVIASEPLDTANRHDWTQLHSGNALIVENDKIKTSTFLD